MTTSTLTTKGQITLPKEIRALLHLQSGDTVDFVLAADGRVEMRKAGQRVEEVFGVLYQPGIGAVDDRTVDDDLGRMLADGDDRSRRQE